MAGSVQLPSKGSFLSETPSVRALLSRVLKHQYHALSTGAGGGCQTDAHRLGMQEQLSCQNSVAAVVENREGTKGGFVKRRFGECALVPVLGSRNISMYSHPGFW